MNTFTIGYPDLHQNSLSINALDTKKIDIRMIQKGWQKHIFNINIERKQTTCFAKIKTDGNNGWLYLIRQFSLPC